MPSEDSTSRKAELQLDRVAPTLASFIKDNQALLTVIGVFTALTLFAGELPLKPFAQVLSLCFLTMTALVWLELRHQFPAEAKGWTLFWFKEVFGWTWLAFLGYWLITAYSTFPFVVYLLPFFGTLTALGLVIKRYELTRKLFDRPFWAKRDERNGLRFLAYRFILLILFAVSIGVSAVVAPPFDALLGDMHSYLATIPK